MDETEVVAAASALGHRVGIYPRESGRWSWWCSCGKATATRINGTLALESAIHHARKVVKEKSVNGVSLQKIGAGASTLEPPGKPDRSPFRTEVRRLPGTGEGEPG